MNVSRNAAWTRLQATVQGLIMNLPNLLMGAVVFLLFLVVAPLVRHAVHAVGPVRPRAWRTSWPAWRPGWCW